MFEEAERRGGQMKTQSADTQREPAATSRGAAVWECQSVLQPRVGDELITGQGSETTRSVEATPTSGKYPCMNRTIFPGYICNVLGAAF